MKSKKFLEDLRKLVIDTDGGKERHYQATLVYLQKNLDALDWLIEQAEKVEQLQQENEKLNQVIDWMNEGCEYNNESHLKTYKQLQQAQAKAEYYEMKYENTGAIFNRRHMLDKIERYENAIKECIDRMNEGGAGTRSFIYEKLKEVMEGTKCTEK
jgi:hypothetical protein